MLLKIMCGKGKVKGKRVFKYNLGDIARKKGVSIQAVLRAKKLGILDPEDFESITAYLNLKRGRRQKMVPPFVSRLN